MRSNSGVPCWASASPLTRATPTGPTRPSALRLVPSTVEWKRLPTALGRLPSATNVALVRDPKPVAAFVTAAMGPSRLATSVAVTPRTPTVSVLSGLSSDGRLAATRSTGRVIRSPSRTKVTVADPGPCLRSAAVSASQSATGLPSKATMRSPCCRPAVFAGEGGNDAQAFGVGSVVSVAGTQADTVLTVGISFGVPTIARTANSSTKAMTKCTKDPAPSTMERCQAFCR